MKKRQERVVNLLFGSILVILGIASLAYALVFRFVVGRSYYNLYEVIVDFVIPLALIYFGYYIFRGKDIPIPKLTTG